MPSPLTLGLADELAAKLAEELKPPPETQRECDLDTFTSRLQETLVKKFAEGCTPMQVAEWLKSHGVQRNLDEIKKSVKRFDPASKAPARAAGRGGRKKSPGAAGARKAGSAGSNGAPGPAVPPAVPLRPAPRAPARRASGDEV